ncbi:MAG: hypothetical protein AAF184_16305 [Pseudomonadota bacterium]
MNRLPSSLKPLALALLASLFAAGAAHANVEVAPAQTVADGQRAEVVRVHHRTAKRGFRRSDRRFHRGSRYRYSSRYGFRRGYGYRPYHYGYRPYGFRSRSFRRGYRY